MDGRLTIPCTNLSLPSRTINLIASREIIRRAAFSFFFSFFFRKRSIISRGWWIYSVTNSISPGFSIHRGIEASINSLDFPKESMLMELASFSWHRFSPVGHDFRYPRISTLSICATDRFSNGETKDPELGRSRIGGFSVFHFHSNRVWIINLNNCWNILTF